MYFLKSKIRKRDIMHLMLNNSNSGIIQISYKENKTLKI